jgi:hypothetical protein
MFGLEKKPGEKFVFDLEKEIKKSPHRGKEILDQVEAQIHDIKTTLREGAKGADFDKLGILLHGYTALQKILRKVK